MLHRVILTGTVVALFVGVASSAVAQGQGQAKQMKRSEQMTATSVADVKWSELKVPGFDPGAQMAVMDGNPGAPGGVYTLRLKFPAGYRFPAHWHPKSEHLTVLTGSFQLGMGTSEDRSMEKTYGPGDFIMMPARHPHYGGSSAETIVQLHGVGPFQIMLSKKAEKTKANN